MKYIYFLITLVVFCILSCKNTPESFQKVSIPKDFTIYSDEDSVVSNIQTFIKQHDKTMIAVYNSDCSACIIALSLWLDFAQKYPEVTPLFAVCTDQSKKSFWVHTYMYYSAPIYVFFDKEYALFQANNISSDDNTFIVDSSGDILLKGSIENKKFEKQYIKTKRRKQIKTSKENFINN